MGRIRSGALVIALLPLGVAACEAGPTAPSTPIAQPLSDPLLGNRIVEALAHDGRLWLRGTNELISFDVRGGDRRTHFTEGVEDMDIAGGTLWVLRKMDGIQHKYSILRWAGAEFRQFVSFATHGDKSIAPVTIFTRSDRPIALLAHGERVIVITDSELRLWEITSRRVREIPIKMNNPRAIPFLSQTSVAMTKDGTAIYLGYNRGEWGGEFNVIHPGTGHISEVTLEPKGYGLRNITGSIPDPDNPHCAVVSTGVSHLGMLMGGVFRACGNKAEYVLRQKITHQIYDTTHTSDEPIFGLSPTRNGYWAVGIEHVFQYERNRWRRVPMPKMQFEGGIWLSRQIAGTIILATDVNGATSMSGDTPLIVAIDQPNP